MKNPMTKFSVSLSVTSRRDTKAVNVILLTFRFTEDQYVLLRETVSTILTFYILSSCDGTQMCLFNSIFDTEYLPHYYFPV